MSKALDKLIATFDAAETKEKQRDSERKCLEEKLGFYKSEVRICEQDIIWANKDAEKILADARTKADEKLAHAESLRQRITKLRDKITDIENRLELSNTKLAKGSGSIRGFLGLGR